MDKQKKELVLSSSSKNRKLILEKIGVPFEVFTPDICEFPLEKEAPIHISNVALYDVESNSRMKVGYRVEENDSGEKGRKVRFNKATGKSIDS